MTTRGHETGAAAAPAVLRVWTDLSLRTKLVLFALGLVTLPGIVFALIAFSGTREALEREVVIQLQQSAERGAEAVTAALERSRSDARSWASQDVMREVLVGDVDKRVSRLLQAVTEGKQGYLEALVVDDSGVVVAAGSGVWIGKRIDSWAIMTSLRTAGEALVGPIASAELDRDVLQIGTSIRNPDPPGGRIGRLILVYDWRRIERALDDIRLKLSKLGKNVAAVVIDEAGDVIGGVSFDGKPASDSGFAQQRWDRAAKPAGLLVGRASLPQTPAWSVLVIERSVEALAPVQRVRNRWILMIGFILFVGLGVAALLARQFMRPLDEVTRATGEIASHPDVELPLLPVRSRDEVGQLAESFNKMATELKRSREEAMAAAKLAFAGELAALIAHEVRTPLSVMRSSAQLLTTPERVDPRHEGELAETIVAEVDRVERVVGGLLQLVKPLEQKLEPTPLGELLERASEFVAPQADRQRIRVTCDRDGEQSDALCDREQIYQVILNLVVNALQALPPGGSINLSILPTVGRFAGFRVADDGPGLPIDLRDRIFRPFVTGREEGTGLGLAFVDRVVKAHQGSVTVETETSKGTAFVVRLPIADTGGRTGPRA
jgi:signal transduction histidine kinase